MKWTPGQKLYLRRFRMGRWHTVSPNSPLEPEEYWEPVTFLGRNENGHAVVNAADGLRVIRDFDKSLISDEYGAPSD